MLLVPRGSEAALWNGLNQGGVFVCRQATYPLGWRVGGASAGTNQGASSTQDSKPSINHQRPVPLEEAKPDILFMTVF